MKPVLARFDSAPSCREAILTLREQGIDVLEAFTPYPEKSIARALAVKKSPLPRIVFAAGLLGGLLSYFVLWFTNVVDYPINVGGRPNHAVPAFIPLTFETTVLFAGVAAFAFGFLLAGLPRYYDPVFEVPEFERVMVDGWFLAIQPPARRTAPQAEGPEGRKHEAGDSFESLLRKIGARSVTAYGRDREVSK